MVSGEKEGEPMNAVDFLDGPRHKSWARLRRQKIRIEFEIIQFNNELASCRQNNPHCAGLDVEPLAIDLPDLPPEPRFEE